MDGYYGYWTVIGRLLDGYLHLKADFFTWVYSGLVAIMAIMAIMACMVGWMAGVCGCMRVYGGCMRVYGYRGIGV